MRDWNKWVLKEEVMISYLRWVIGKNHENLSQEVGFQV